MVASYRIQLDADITFEFAVGLLDHLQRLGITHLYTSPIFSAVPGSSHFYDGVDPTTVSEELGGEDGFRRLVEQLRKRDMSVVIDMVPNHLSVAVPRRNRWFWETLRDGPGSPSARFFDIDWAAGDGRIVLPILEAPLAELEASGAVHRRVENGETILEVQGMELPGGDDEQRHYRLEQWRDGVFERNYRVFFAVNDLAAVRMEDPVVFETLTAGLARLVEDDLVDGVRLDHVDGLADPTATIRRYRDVLGPDRLLLVEKITIGDEPLPAQWPIAGATGYDFAADVVRLFCDPVETAGLMAALGGYLGGGLRPGSFAEVEHAAKEEWMVGGLRPGVAQLARLSGIGEGTIRAAAGAFDVYRTYLTPGESSPVDVAAVRRAFEAAAGRDQTGDLERLERIIVQPSGTGEREIQRRFQQLTAPVMAKASEDTAMYRHVPLLALNEVGADPDVWTIGVDRFHARASERLRSWPGAMVTTSTHDTKRSEDVRARLAVLTELPTRWVDAIASWEAELGPAVVEPVDPGDRLLLWQTIVGTWPSVPERGYGERLSDYLTKALREAGRRTSWRSIDDGYEGDAQRLLASALDRLEPLIDRFVTDHLVAAGRRNSLIQVALRCLVPGFGDLYQGCETWDLSLVDPDNRRPIDWPEVQRLSRVQAEANPPAAWASSDDGLVKTIVVARCLGLRARHPAAFDRRSTYTPLPGASRTVAFARGDDLERVVVVAPLAGASGSVRLPDRRWTCIFSGETFTGSPTIESMTREFPLSVLSAGPIDGDRPG